MHAFRAPFIAPILSALVIVAAAAPARAQHGEHGSMPTPMAPMIPMPMAPMATNPDQLMEKIDGTMAKADVAVRDLQGMHDRLGPGVTHDQILASMNGMLEQMRQVHGMLGALIKDPGFTSRRDAMKAFEDASRDFDKIAKAFQAMTKNMGRVMKETAQ